MKGKTFIEVTPPPHCGAHTWSVEELDSVELVFDGEDENNPKLEEPVPKKTKNEKLETNNHGGMPMYMWENCLWLT